MGCDRVDQPLYPNAVHNKYPCIAYDTGVFVFGDEILMKQGPANSEPLANEILSSEAVARSRYQLSRTLLRRGGTLPLDRRTRRMHSR